MGYKSSMSDPLPDLPIAFQTAPGIALPQRDGFVIGTVINHIKIHYTSKILPPWKAPDSFDLVAIELDLPMNGTHTTMAIIHPKEGHDSVGRRLRGKLFSSDDQMAEIGKMASDYNDAYERQYEFMKNSNSVFFDWRTLHIAADDSRLQATGDAVRVCLDMGLDVSSGEDYYVAHGIQCGSELQAPDASFRPLGYFLDQGPKHS